jgi:hypothetical protein
LVAAGAVVRLVSRTSLLVVVIALVVYRAGVTAIASIAATASVCGSRSAADPLVA